MPTEADPIIGNWYQNTENDQRFEVVAVDEDEGIVEIQHYDGEVEEIDIDTWYEMDLSLIEAPEDWTGPMDSVTRDDLGYAGTEDLESGRPRRAGYDLDEEEGEEEGDEEDEWR